MTHTRLEQVPEWAMRVFCDRANLKYEEVFASQGADGVALRSAVRAGGSVIAQYEQEPTHPDVLIVRAVLHAYQRSMTPPDSGWGDMSHLEGSYDNLPSFQAALAAYRLAKEAI